MLDDLLVETFIQTHYGYGNYQGDYWFIGIEENGGYDEKDISNRISTVSNREQHELKDLAEYHKAIGVTNLFSKGAILQPTWNRLIRILLAATLPDFNKEDKEDVRNYQINELGRRDKNTCLLELFPLPSPSIKKWSYNQYSLLPYLADRKTYIKYCVDFRVNHIKSRIQRFNPKVVIFYTTSCQNQWQKIAGVPFSIIETGLYNYQIGTNDKTLFAIIKHPVPKGKGIPHEYFHSLGKLIASRLNQS